ncbi:MAG TPA: N-6 DNA methylase, partial [Chitinolyticbacter sp.]|nr:N-6 DNA methylase [Chitinolyticbacter sp.]
AAGVTAQEKPTDLFTINPEEIGQGGDKAKYANNVAAIRILKQLESTNRQATAEEQAALAKYVGWGGLPGAFERSDGTANKGWEKQVAELKSLLTPDEYAAAAASTRNAHYTSPEIVSGMWSLMERLGFTGGRVLEPSVGVGNFFGLMPQGLRKSSALHGVELDRITSGLATQLYPEAKIARMGYQDFTVPDGYFDVAIGNPPFGSEKLYDGKRKDLSGFSIHNYFFARSVDALRPGGVMAMVVTNRFLDGTSDKARSYIADRADLVGAIRLPNNAFAKNAGTEVTTDIIVLRKRAPGEKPSGNAWLNSVDFKDRDGNTVPLNEYFAAHPENMLGEFGAYGTMYRKGDTALVARDGQNTAQLLDAAISRFPANILTPAVEVKPETRETVQAENVRVGSMFVNGDGRVMVRGEDTLGERTGTAVDFRSAKAEERVKGMLRIRDALSRLRQLQLSNTASEKAINEARERLNKTYDSFVQSNGPINSQANKLLFRDDPTWPQISALEDDYDRGVSADVAKRTGEDPRKQSAKKAAIFSRRTQQPYSAPTSAATAKDALVATLAERGRVDMDMMASLYGKTPEAIAAELGDLLYNDPAAGWQTRDAYLSGNVKQKLAQAEAAAKTDPSYARNVEALREVQPKDIEAVDINVKPGVSWIPVETMAAFADHIAESKGSTAFYNRLTANWSFPKLEASTSATARYGTGRMSVGQIIEAAAAQKAVQIYDTHQDGSRTLNETETQLANDKVNQVKQEWDRWLWSDDTRRQTLARLYNDQFNTDVAREFDGSHLTFPGKVSDDIVKLRPHQNNFVWRVVQGGSTLADHVVGAGKTFSLIAAAMELRRMGLARKPVFAVPNHLVGQWALDFIKLYPGANVLAATKADFEKANRKRFFARIATGDWDAVIVAHSSFGKVAVKPETEAEFIREEIADLTSSIAAIEEAEGKKTRNVKQAQERKAKMEERLKKLIDIEGKDDSLYWDDLGIDALFVDEAHEFKNLAYSSGMRGVAGL